jgi:hypothetical protein
MEHFYDDSANLVDQADFARIAVGVHVGPIRHRHGISEYFSDGVVCDVAPVLGCLHSFLGPLRPVSVRDVVVAVLVVAADQIAGSARHHGAGLADAGAALESPDEPIAGFLSSVDRARSPGVGGGFSWFGTAVGLSAWAVVEVVAARRIAMTTSIQRVWRLVPDLDG